MPRHWESNYKGPLPGNQLEFITPFAKKGMEASTDAESRVVAYCNEAVGFGLGWKLAPARIGVFANNAPAEGGTKPLNAGKHFSKRANKGANQYKFMLVPQTEIPVVYFNPVTFNKENGKFIRKSISVSFDRTISVTEMKLWVVGAGPAITGALLVPKIYAIVTPSLKVHPVRSRSNPAQTIYVSNAMKDLAKDLGIAEINFSN